MTEKPETRCRLVVCFDGTWNTPDKGVEPTNVVHMVRAVRSRDDDGTPQLVFYDKGIGSAGGTDRITGGGFGKGLTENVLDGYRFLANNHAPGDEIYIFGFSRGAYTARSLAGLLGLAGLLPPRSLGRGLDAVMAIYRRPDVDRAARQAEIEGLGLGDRRAAPIRCVGVWDTVGSLGIPGDIGRGLKKHYFHDVELGANIDLGLHAVALDEKRAAFSPTLWVTPDGAPVRSDQTIEQVWFPGVHSNVGGSYPDPGLSDIAMDWMARRVDALTCLALDRSALRPVGPENAAARAVESRSLLYKGSVLYPYQRLINGEVPAYEGFGAWFRRTFPKLDRRNIPPAGLQTVNEALHVSVLERWQREAVPHDCPADAPCPERPYRPINLAAAIRAHHEDRTMPVVDWDGEPVSGRDPWPSRASLG